MNPKAINASPIYIEHDQEELSQREQEVLRWVFYGKTNAEISIILSLSVHTVRTYLERAAMKLDATNRIMAASIAVRRGLVKL
jgi:LuxR family transcriptional regulator, quorum-sensing system regulator CinR